MKRIARISMLVVALVSGAAVVGCGGGKEAWSANQVATPEVQITPQDIYRQKHRLYVKVNFTNLSKSTLRVDRDAMQLKLENGRVLGRSVGTTSTHRPYDVLPGQSHQVFVDFKDDDINENSSNAQVIWQGSIMDGTRVVEVPPTPIVSRY